MVSEDSRYRTAFEPTVLSAAVHAKCLSGKPLEPFDSQMFTCIHSPNNVGEAAELSLFATEKRIPFEEGDHLIEEIPPPTDNKHKSVVANRVLMIFPELSTIEVFTDEIKNLLPTNILTYTKFRHKLKTNSRAWIPLERNMEAAFSVYKSCDVGIQSFLLIDRTCRVVTVN